MDEGDMESSLKKGGQPAYPPGWRPPLPSERVDAKTPPQKLADASAEAAEAPSFKGVDATLVHGLREDGWDLSKVEHRPAVVGKGVGSEREGAAGGDKAGGAEEDRAWDLPPAQGFDVR